MAKRQGQTFFALFPVSGAAEAATQLVQRMRREHGLQGKALPEARLHITLSHLGDFEGIPPNIVEIARAAAGSIAAPSFEVTFDRVMSFGGKSGNLPFVLWGKDGVAALTAFQKQLVLALKRHGLRVRSGFRPHMTLLYDDHSVAERLVEPVSWVAREFVLVHSLLGQTRHVHLAHWPLGG